MFGDPSEMMIADVRLENRKRIKGRGRGARKRKKKNMMKKIKFKKEDMK